MTVTPISGKKVPTRRISFDEVFGQVPRHFAAHEDLMQSHLAATLSSLFPDGEDFFVRAVRRYRDRVEDPELKRQVAGFIGQEAVHGREHRSLNDRLAELGYPTKSFERRTKRLLSLQERLFGPEEALSLTAALEHYTATLAELVLSDQATRDLFGDPRVRDLFTWHALEESEHKAVAFDVYRLAVGSERRRIRTMRLLRYGFLGWMAVHMAISLAGDPATYRRGNLRRSWRAFRSSPLMTRAMWQRLGEYNRRGFHPDDRDTGALVEHWRTELFGEYGSLNELLAAGAGA